MANVFRIRTSFLKNIFVVMAASVLVYKSGIWIRRALSCKYSADSEFHATQKCLPGGKIAFNIGYIFSHSPRWLAKFPDGGVGWYVARGQKYYVYEPGLPLQTITKEQYQSLRELGSNFKCAVYIPRPMFLNAADVRDTNPFIKIQHTKDFSLVNIGPLQYGEFSFDQLSLPDPANYNGYAKVDDSAEALNEKYRR